MSKIIRTTLALIVALSINQTTYATIAVDETPWPVVDPALQITPRSSIEKRPIFIFAFVHDDIPESKIPSLFSDHFLELAKEINTVTGRRLSVEFVRHTPPYTSYAYKAPSQRSYEGWAALAEQYRNNKNLPHNRTTKFLLLTNNAMVEGEVLGVASLGQPFGIASLLGKQIVGHELGHMFDANHDLAEIRNNGWWCETFMAAKVNPLLSNCYVYTDGNRERIKSYLSNTP